MAEPKAGREAGKLYIVFDGPPGPESGRFVEVEDPTGASIRLGEWIQEGDYWNLVIPDPRILNKI